MRAGDNSGVAGRRCDGVMCMKEIVLKYFASIFQPKNCKAISLRGKIKDCYTFLYITIF